MANGAESHQVFFAVIGRVAVLVVNLDEESSTLRGEQPVARAQALDAAAVTVPALALFDGEGDLWPVAGVAGGSFVHGRVLLAVIDFLALLKLQYVGQFEVTLVKSSSPFLIVFCFLDHPMALLH
jgi:hypothetical protein